MREDEARAFLEKAIRRSALEEKAFDYIIRGQFLEAVEIYRQIDRIRMEISDTPEGR